MDQTLYYTFSTTAQVLATMLVFYGLFFLQRMQVFRKRFAELTENFLMEIDEKDKGKEEVVKKVRMAFCDKDWERLPYRTKSSLRQGKYSWIIENAIEKVLAEDSENPILKVAKSGMTAIIDARKLFTRYSIVAVVIGFVQLIGTMLILSLVPLLGKYCNCLLYELLVGNILLLVVFISFIAWAIIKTFLKEIEHDEES